jgi:predicted membrane metal-binding protein
MAYRWFICFDIPSSILYSIFFIVGILSGIFSKSIPIAYFIYFFSILFLIGIISRTYHNKRATYFLILSGGFWLLGLIRTHTVYYQHEATYKQVSKNPQNIYAFVRDVKIALFYQVLTIELLSHQACIKIFIRKKPNLNPGDIIFCDLSIRNRAHDFYALRENIIASIFMQNFSYELITETKSFKYQFLKSIYKIRKALSDKLKAKMSSKSYMLFCSLFLGQAQTRTHQTDILKDIFSYWGISHYLARSGLHVIIIMVIWSFLLTLLPMHINSKQYCLLGLLIIYHLLSWPSISFMRAVNAFALGRLCLLRDLPIQSLHIIALTCFIVLFFNPFYITALDFQLTFILTFALTWIQSLKRELTKAKYVL